MELKDKKLFLLDMDGTLYLGDNVFENTHDFLRRIKSNGARYYYLTNNSSKSSDDYVTRLKKYGIPSVPEDFITSGDVTLDHLKENYSDCLFYVFGTTSLKKKLQAEGIRVTDRLEDGIGGLLLGFDTELTFQKLEDSCILLGRDIHYIATHPDLVCPTAYGSVPDCGSIISILENATGRRPYVIGKPKPDMIYQAIKRAGCQPEEAVMIGDRIDTDIASGRNAGIDTILVLSGEGTEEEAKEKGILPTYVMKDIGEVYHAICKNKAERDA